MENTPKKILFICGSLQPGHDGVGDYTRALAGELISRGIEARIVAINDRGVAGIEKGTQVLDVTAIPVLRLSHKIYRKERRKEFRQLVTEFNPNWISLQFVPYAYSKRGIPFWLSFFLKSDLNEINWHIMFHETYIGAEKGFKAKFIQRCQIAIIKKLITSLQPIVVHTSTPSYQQRIRNIGIESKLLGLFGNIPIIGNPTPNKENRKYIQGVYFGIVPNLPEFRYFTKKIKQFLDSESIYLEIIFCGAMGEKGPLFIDTLEKEVGSSNLKISNKGRLSTEGISELFLSSDFGIARVPPHLVGKSGSAIAMLEHGLPLWIPLALTEEEIQKHCDYRSSQCFAHLTLERLKTHPSIVPQNRLVEITSLFTSELELEMQIEEV